jgi:hypothetical protein
VGAGRGASAAVLGDALPAASALPHGWRHAFSAEGQTAEGGEGFTGFHHGSRLVVPSLGRSLDGSVTGLQREELRGAMGCSEAHPVLNGRISASLEQDLDSVFETLCARVVEA